MVLPIITTAEYKAYAGISGTAQDAQLAIIIPGIQAELERLTGRMFDKDEFTEYYDGAESPTIGLNNYPVRELDSVVLVNRDLTVAYTYDLDSIKIEEATGLISRQLGVLWGATIGCPWYQPLPGPTTFQPGPWFPGGWRNIRVVYTGGYANADMPPDLKLLMYDLTATKLAQIGQDMSMKSETLGHYKYDRGEGAADFWGLFAQRIAPWKRVTT